MVESVLSAASKEDIKILSSLSFLDQFYLGGGTGCALYLGHRISEDLDFFSEQPFSHREVKDVLTAGGTFITDYSDSQTLVGRFNSTKTGFFHYGYPLIKETHDFLSLHVGSLEDIGCMKIDTIAGRGKKRDFVDLYFILEYSRTSLKEFFYNFELKYRQSGYNLHHILKSLVYFEDADPEPEPRMLREFSWENLKAFFKQQIKDFGGR
jgi:predicted nucleotidyltransferase component of viral defense system